MHKKVDKFNEILIETMRNMNFYQLRRQRYWDVPFVINPHYQLLLKQIIAEWGLLRQENPQLRDQLLRAKADLENFRKRAKKEREEIINRANETIMVDLLNILDNFERGLKPGGELEGVAKSLFHGIEMNYGELIKALSKHGLAKIETEEKSFDPYYHEAVATEYNPDIPENRITAILRPGYVYKGKVLRPAMVKVNRKD